MLQHAAKCSLAMNLVPRPAAGKATVTWLLNNLRRSLINSMREDFYVICVIGAIEKWDTELRIKCL